MNNSFSQMAFNFGAETPPAPPPLKVEENGYAVGQENGYSGVRVRIKSLKNAKKDSPPEETPRDVNEGLLNDALIDAKAATPKEPKQEDPQVVELKLFDLPAIESPVPVAESLVQVVESPVPAHVADAGAMDNGFTDDIAAEPVTMDSASEPADSGPAERTDNTPAEVITGKAAAPADSSSGGSPDKDSPDKSSPDNDSLNEPLPGKNGSPVKSAKPAKSKRGRKSLKQVAAEADLIEIPGDDILFSKQYYTMRAVAEMFRVNQSLLRFWETEFDILQPRKNKKGDRYFRPVDIKNLHLIYHLLRQRKYTIEGAKEFLKTNKKAEERFEAIQRLQQLKAFLLEWKAQL
jgi:DNA-binding transcriptional MerR regulator